MNSVIVSVLAGLLLGVVITFFTIRRVIKSKIEKFFDSLKTSDETIRQILGHQMSEGELNDFAKGLKTELYNQVKHRLADDSIGKNISKAATDKLIEKLSTNNSESNQEDGSMLENARRLFGGFVRNGVSSVLETHKDKIEDVVGSMINEKLNEMIRGGADNQTDNPIWNLIDKEIEKLFDTRVEVLVKGKEEELEELKQAIVKKIVK